MAQGASAAAPNRLGSSASAAGRTIRGVAAPRKLLVDTDPGVDDALALLFALRSPDVEVVACTSTFGNASTAACTANLVRLLNFAGRAIPIGLGAAAPLLDAPRPHAAVVHGADGLGDVGEAGVSLPPATLAALPYAANLIVDTVLAHPGEVTLVMLGPLTNLALALALEPRIENLVAEVVIMGGAHSVPGNLTAVGEANIVHDPHAAERVLAASWPTTLVTIDVTGRVVMTGAYLEALAASGGAEGRFLHAVSQCYARFHRERHGLDGIYAHDPVALMAVVAPELFTFGSGPATVITSGAAAGQTLIDRRGGGPVDDSWAARAPVRYSVDVDAPALLELFRSRFS